MKIFLTAAAMLIVVSSALGGDDPRPPTPAERSQFLKAFSKLGSDSYKERKAAAEEITALGPPILALLAERKDSPDPEIEEAVNRIIKAIRREIAHNRIVRLIEDTGVDDDPEELIRLFNSEKEEDRKQAFLRLSVRRTPACVPVVSEFLDDPSDKIVDMAIVELRHIMKGKNNETALQILKVVERTPPEEERIIDRISNFLSFADCRDEKLVEAVKDIGDKKVREMVFTRMVLAPEEHFVFAFVSMLGSRDRFVRRYCAGGIEVIIREVVQKDGREMFEFDGEKLKRLSSALFPHLDSGDPVVVQVVTGAIGRTGECENTDKLASLLENRDLSTARRAAVSLGLLKARKAVPALLKVLEAGNYDVLPETADALARIADPASFAPLLKLLKKKDIPFRELLLYAISEVDLKRSAEELPGLLSDEDVAVRSLAVDRMVKALRSFPQLQASKMAELLQIMREGESNARIAAARIVGETGGISLLPELKKICAGNDPGVRSATFMPIAMIAGEGAREFLSKNVKDPDYQVRVRAAEALGYLGDWSDFLKIRLVPLEVRGESVADAVRMIAWATGINLVIDPAAVRMCSLDTVVVNSELKGKTLSSALDSLEKSFGLSWDTSHFALFITVKAREESLKAYKPPSAGLGCTKADLDIEKKLSERVSCDIVSEEIGAFFDKITARTGIAFRLDDSIEARLAEPLRRIDFTISDIPLSELLWLVLAPRGLSATIEGGEMIISVSGK